jgi:hypothetical protein
MGMALPKDREQVLGTPGRMPLARLWAVWGDAGDEWGGVDWQWQPADAAMGTALMGGNLVGRHPTDRGQKG